MHRKLLKEIKMESVWVVFIPYTNELEHIAKTKEEAEQWIQNDIEDTNKWLTGEGNWWFVGEEGRAWCEERGRELQSREDYLLNEWIFGKSGKLHRN
jgi:hypothetical protein